MEKKEKINFIITCYNREQYWEYLEKILKSYKIIDANYFLVYNGIDPNFDGYYHRINLNERARCHYLYIQCTIYLPFFLLSLVGHLL